MFSLKILNGPLSGFEMTLTSGLWYIYTYIQEQGGDQLLVENNVSVASNNVIFIPLFAGENARNVQLQLDGTLMTCAYGWADDTTMRPLALQEKIYQGPLMFALKPHEEEWVLTDACTAAALPEAESVVEPVSSPVATPWHQRRPLWIWLLCGLLLAVVILSVSESLQVKATASQPQWVVTPTIKQAMQRRLTDAGITWLTLDQDDQHQLRLHLLTVGLAPEEARRAEQVLRKAYPELGSVGVTSHNLEELQQALQALFQQAGVKYQQVVTPAGIYLSVQQPLTPETLDYLNRQLKTFYQRWGQERVHISIQFPPAYGDAPHALLQREGSQFIWDRKNHIFQPTKPVNF